MAIAFSGIIDFSHTFRKERSKYAKLTKLGITRFKTIPKAKFLPLNLTNLT